MQKKNQNAENNVNPENNVEKNVVAPQQSATDKTAKSEVVSPQGETAEGGKGASKKDALKEKPASSFDDLTNALKLLKAEFSESAKILARARSQSVPGWRRLDQAIFSASQYVERLEIAEVDRSEYDRYIGIFAKYREMVELKRKAFEAHDLARLEVAEATFFNVAFDGSRFVVDVPFAARSTQFGEKRNASIKTFEEKGFTAPGKLPDAFKTFADIYRWTLPSGRFMKRFAALCAVYEESPVFKGEKFQLVAVKKDVVKYNDDGKPVKNGDDFVFEKAWWPELLPAHLVEALGTKKIVFGSPELYREETNGAIGRSAKAKTSKGQFFAETVSKTVQGYLTLYYFDKLQANEVRYNATK